MDKHLKIVREATWDVRAKWRDLGIELGISVGTLEVSNWVNQENYNGMYIAGLLHVYGIYT